MAKASKGLEYRRIDQLSTRKYGRKPDLWVNAMNKRTDEKRKIGAAWHNEDGSISIALDSFTVLEASPDLLVTLFPVDTKEPPPP